MAVKVSDLKDKFLNAPFTDAELKAILNSENQIDSYLEKTYCGYSIPIELRLVEFSLQKRGEKMKKHLISLYEQAGWKVERKSGGDDEDYYVFSEK